MISKQISLALSSNKSLLRGLSILLITIVALVVLCTAIFAYLQVLPLFTQKKNNWKYDIVTISNRVSSINTLFGSSASFSRKELETIKNIEGVQDADFFKVAQFKVDASSNMGGSIPALRGDLFFESVPSQYIDIDKTGWNWNKTDGIIPIVIPKTYLNLYNFGFSSGQDLPQVSESLAKMVQFDVQIGNRYSGIKLKGQIEGFSDRINTILVPQDFLEWANHKYAKNKKNKPSRIIAKISPEGSEAFYNLCKENGWQIDGEKLKNSEARYYTLVLLSILYILGVILIASSLWIVLLSVQLQISKNSENIKTLRLLGYSLNKVNIKLTIRYLVWYAIIHIIALLLLKEALTPINEKLSLMSLELYFSSTFYIYNIILATCLATILSLLSYFSLRKVWTKDI